MSGNSTLVVHCGGVRRTRQELAGLHTPAGTATWKPIPHLELVEALVEGLHGQGVEVTREEFCTMGHDDAKLLGTLDLRIANLDTDEFSMALGLRAANDKTMSIQLVAAARVLVCDNMAFSGSAGAVFLRKRHTTRLDLRAVVPSAVDQFLERAGTFRLDIDRMRDHALRDGQAKEFLHDAFAAGIVPIRLFPVVSRLYFDDQVQAENFPDRTLWSLNNAFTEALKRLRAAPQYGCGLSIGRLFGRLLHRTHREPNAVVVGTEAFR